MGESDRGGIERRGKSRKISEVDSTGFYNQESLETLGEGLEPVNLRVMT
jgi:hypothetical protein